MEGGENSRLHVVLSLPQKEWGAGLEKGLLPKHVDLNSVPSTQFEKLGVVSPACDPSTGPLGAGRSLGSPASQASLLGELQAS